MITSISIENFKGIGQRVTIPLKPITLLFGPNSAGKSTILHALHYAREILERRNLDADRTLAGGDFVDLGGFHNFVHNHDLKLPVTIGFEIQRSGKDYEFLFEQIGQWQAYESEHGEVTQRITEVNSCSVEISVAWSTWLKRPFVSHYSIALDGMPLLRLESSPDQPGAKLAGLNLRHPIFGPYDVEVEDRDDESLALETLWRKQGLLQDSTDESSRVLPLGQADALPDLETELALNVGHLDKEALDFLSKIDSASGLATANLLSWITIGPAKVLLDELRQGCYLGPLRVTPHRDFQPGRFFDESQWASGLAAWDILKNTSNDLVKQVNAWISPPDRLDTGYELHVRRFKELDIASPLMIQLTSERAFDDIEDLKSQIDALPEQSKLTLVDNRTQIEVAPEDVGEGIAQILPVVVAVLSPTARLVMIEQPELHVHPRIQVALGDLFIQRTKMTSEEYTPITDGVLLVETHSEHLLLRLLRRIRETGEGSSFHPATSLTSAHLAVLYVESGDQGTTVKELRVNEEGDFIDPWPDGFFDERGKELLG